MAFLQGPLASLPETLGRARKNAQHWIASSTRTVLGVLGVPQNVPYASSRYAP